MTTEEFVKEKYPNAFAQKFWSGRDLHKSIQRAYFLIYSSRVERKMIGEGDTKSKAWKDAKQWIIESQNQD